MICKFTCKVHVWSLLAYKTLIGKMKDSSKILSEREIFFPHFFIHPTFVEIFKRLLCFRRAFGKLSSGDDFVQSFYNMQSTALSGMEFYLNENNSCLVKLASNKVFDE